MSVFIEKRHNLYHIRRYNLLAVLSGVALTTLSVLATLAAHNVAHSAICMRSHSSSHVLNCAKALVYDAARATK
jgi:hypothetical protein